MRKVTLGCVLLLCAAGSLTWGQSESASSWDRYLPRTMQSVIDQHLEAARADLERDAGNPSIHFHLLLTGDNFPSRTVLEYRGQERALTPDRMRLLQAWKDMRGPSFTVDLAAMFGTELLFREGDREFWIPVQRTLIASIHEELKPGDKLTGQVMWVGAIHMGKQWEWLFVMNGFED